jgi:hypothetical protein
MSPFVKALTVLGVTVGAACVTAPAAWAGTDQTVAYYNASGQLAAHAHYTASSETFSLCDDLDDGYSAVLQFLVSTSRGSTWNNGGAGTCTMTTVNAPAGMTLQFRVCVGQPSTGILVGCSSWATTTTSPLVGWSAVQTSLHSERLGCRSAVWSHRKNTQRKPIVGRTEP